MPPITWRTVNLPTAPNFGGELTALDRASRNLGGSLRDLGGTVQKFTDDKVKRQTDEFVAHLNSLPDDVSRKQALADANDAFLNIGRVNKELVSQQNQDFRVAGEGRAVLQDTRDQTRLDETLRKNLATEEFQLKQFDATQAQRGIVNTRADKQFDENTRSNLARESFQDRQFNATQLENAVDNARLDNQFAEQQGLREDVLEESIRKAGVAEERQERLDANQKRIDDFNLGESERKQAIEIEDREANAENLQLTRELEKDRLKHLPELRKIERLEEGARKRKLELAKNDAIDNTSIRRTLASFKPTGDLDADIARHAEAFDEARDNLTSEKNMKLFDDGTQRLADRYSTDVGARIERLTGGDISTLPITAYTATMRQALEDSIVGNLEKKFNLEGRAPLFTETQLRDIARKEIARDLPSKAKFEKEAKRLGLSNTLDGRAMQRVVETHDMDQAALTRFHRNPAIDINKRVRTRLSGLDVEFNEHNLGKLDSSIRTVQSRLRKTLKGLTSTGKEQLDLGIMDLFSQVNYDKDVGFNDSVDDFVLSHIDKETDISKLDTNQLLQAIQESFPSDTKLGKLIDNHFAGPVSKKAPAVNNTNIIQIPSKIPFGSSDSVSTNSDIIRQFATSDNPENSRSQEFTDAELDRLERQQNRAKTLNAIRQLQNLGR